MNPTPQPDTLMLAVMTLGRPALVLSKIAIVLSAIQIASCGTLLEDLSDGGPGQLDQGTADMGASDQGSVDVPTVPQTCSVSADCEEGEYCQLPVKECRIEPGCGDGVRQANEACDDGNPSASAGCLACRVQDGFRCTYEEDVASTCTEDAPRDLGVGRWHWCVIDAEGTLSCGGHPLYANSETDKVTTSSQAVIPAGLGPVSDVAGGHYHTCVIRQSDRKVQCFGSNLAWFKNTGVWIPQHRGQVDVPATLGPVSELSASHIGTCALDESGVATCWGRYNAEVVETERFDSISAGTFHGCGLRLDGTARCWGDSNLAQESIGIPSDLGPFSLLGGGALHVCAIETSGETVCWGQDTQQIRRTQPPAENFTSVSGGYYSSCGLLESGEIRCWGVPTKFSNHGQHTPPTGHFLRLDCSYNSCCAIRVNGEVACWGEIAQVD